MIFMQLHTKKLKIEDLCVEHKIELKNQTYTGFITNYKKNSLMNYVGKLSLLKNNVLQSINNSNINVICVNVVLKM